MHVRGRAIVLLTGLCWAFCSSVALAEERRRPVRRAPDLSAGRAFVQVVYNLSPATVEEARINEDEIAALGLRLIGSQLVGDPLPASGFRVIVGEQNVMVRDDGTFTLLPVPAGITQGQVVGKDGAPAKTFVVGDHIVPKGTESAPIILTIELSDGPNLMNEWDTGDDSLRTASGHEHSHHHGTVTPSGPCPSATGCTIDTNCPNIPTQCCLDYNGLCADGNRYSGCDLRFVQFLGST